MSREIIHLTAHMAMLAGNVQAYCRERDVTLLIYCTRRTFDEQAVLYRQGRPWHEIKTRMDSFKDAGLDVCAEAIERVGPQTGDKVTNAFPGESWHNYGMAFDAVPTEEGKALWDYNEHKEKWNVYAEALHIHGLRWGGNFKSFKDYPHAQLLEGNPLLKFTKTIIERAALWAY